MDKETLKNNQIDKTHGSEPILDIPFINTTLSVNKIHAIELGIGNSTIIAYIYTINPILSIPLLIEIYLASTGYSILFDKLKPQTEIPNYAYTYTIRKNPWYYLMTMTIFIPLFIYIYNEKLESK